MLARGGVGDGLVRTAAFKLVRISELNGDCRNAKKRPPPPPPDPPPPQGCIGRGGGTPPPLQGAQPMPNHCPPDARRRLQWHL